MLVGRVESALTVLLCSEQVDLDARRLRSFGSLVFDMSKGNISVGLLYPWKVGRNRGSGSALKRVMICVEV